MLRKSSFTLAALIAAGGAALLTSSPGWADSRVVQFEPVLVAHSGQRADASRHARQAPRQSNRQRRVAPPVVLPGIGIIGARALQNLALNETQTQQWKQARDAQRALQAAQRDAMQAVRKLRQEQLDANTLDPRALRQAQQAAMDQLQPQRQAVQNQWLGVWDSLDAEQQTKVVQALKRQDGRHDRGMPQRGRRG